MLRKAKRLFGDSSKDGYISVQEVKIAIINIFGVELSKVRIP